MAGWGRGAHPWLSSDPQQNLDVRNPPLLVSWQNPILFRVAVTSQTLLRTDETGVATCSLSTRGPPLFKDSADHSGMGLRSEKNQAGSPPPPESQGPWSPCAEGAGSSPGGKGLEKCVWGVGSHPRTDLAGDDLQKPSIAFTFSFCVLGQLL